MWGRGGGGGGGDLLDVLHCVDAGANQSGFAEETHFAVVGLRWRGRLVMDSDKRELTCVQLMSVRCVDDR